MAVGVATGAAAAADRGVSEGANATLGAIVGMGKGRLAVAEGGTTAGLTKNANAAIKRILTTTAAPIMPATANSSVLLCLARAGAAAGGEGGT